MERVYITDKTLKQTGRKMPLSFREKIELSRLIDKLEPDAIELPAIENEKVDSLLIKSIVTAVRHSEIAVPVKLNKNSVSMTWAALKEAHSARLQVEAPVSSVQIEYLSHLKPAALSSLVVETIRECTKYTHNIEFIAQDASRANTEFMISLIRSAIDAGAGRITFQESAGAMLPEELSKLLQNIISELNVKEKIIFGVDCSNALSLADACAVESIRIGIREIKAAAYPLDCTNLGNVVRILAMKGEKLGVLAEVRKEELRRITGQIENLCRTTRSSTSPFENGVRDQENKVGLSIHDSKESIYRAMEELGYILSSEDQEKVYSAFMNVAEKKENLSLRELDAIIAAEAMQVPPAYIVQQFAFNSGNDIGAMAHIKLSFKNQILDGIAAGDGVVDASFLALEKAVGKHFELDDFQIQAVTEGKEAMGETIVRLRNQGRLYSGRGISTDIVVASIMAYINALNKIVFEEETV